MYMYAILYILYIKDFAILRAPTYPHPLYWGGSVFATFLTVCVVYMLHLASVHQGIPWDLIFILCHGSINYLLQLNVKKAK